MFREVHPVLPSRDVMEAIDFFLERLGFQLIFQDAESPGYAGLRRDQVEIHLQWHDSLEWERVERPMQRFVVDDVDTLHDELRDKNVFHAQTRLHDTAWGTREFAFFDPDQNGLTFYRDS